MAMRLAGAAAGGRGRHCRERRPGDELSINLQQPPWTGDLDGMIARRYIRVLVPYSRTLYFVDLGGTQRGMSYDFMRAFEDDLNRQLGRGDLRVHVVFIPVSRAHLLPLLLAGRRRRRRRQPHHHTGAQQDRGFREPRPRTT